MTVVAALALFVALAQPGSAHADATADTGETVSEYPSTLERIWYRPPRKFGVRKRGFLTVTQDELWFSGDKKATSISMDDVRVISFGKMKGNVDTDWVVLAIGDPALEELVGFADARKLGGNIRTREIFNLIKRAARKASAAQYRVPPGFRAYDKVDSQFTLAIPESWSYHLESVVVVGDRTPWGTILFTSEPIRRPKDTAGSERRTVDETVLEGVLAGKTPAFFLERTPIERGMGCAGFSKKGRAALLDRVRRDSLFRKGGEIAEPSISDVRIGGCSALHIEARGQGPDGGEALLDLYAVAHRDTLFLFGLRATVENHEAFREPFSTAIDTVTFSVAR